MKEYKKFKRVKIREGTKGIIFEVQDRVASVILDKPYGGARMIAYLIDGDGRYDPSDGIAHNLDIVKGWPFVPSRFFYPRVNGCDEG